MNKWKLGLVLTAIGCGQTMGIEVSTFCEAQVPGNYILPAGEDHWTWGMAPIYDDEGKLHVFNSVIPNDGVWSENSKIVHWTADSVDGPYTLEGDLFVSDEAAYHNPQVSKVGDTYVLVFLLNRYKDENGSKQEVGIATAKSPYGPWTESSLNPIIPASGKMGGFNMVHASNPTFVVTPEGKFRIYYKSMTDQYTGRASVREISMAESDHIEGPYVNYEHNPVISYADQKVDIEDPYAFYYNDMYYMIVEDRQGVKNLLEGNPIPVKKRKNGGVRPGLIYTSLDGIDWGEPEVGYLTNEMYFGDELARSERPSILWKDGKPEYLFLACHDDKPSAGYFVRIVDWKGK
ncbi:glycoside hydrolase family protein [Pontiellaceae bacterium B1224]|nr:glycoside hydrolase family protein [Pontiellaceae bacterium B1224]